MNKILFRSVFVGILCLPLLAHAGIIDDQKAILKTRKDLNDQKYYLDSLLKFTDEFSEKVISANILKADLLRNSDQSVEALSHLQAVTSHEFSSKFPELLAQAYLMTSDIYQEKKSFDIASKFLTEAYILYDGIGLELEKAVVLVKSAHSKKKQNEYSSAIRDLKQAYDIYVLNEKIIISNEIAKEIGTLAFESGEFIDAENFLKTALRGYQKTNEYSEQIKVYEALGQLFEFEKKYDDLIDTQKKVAALAEAHTDVDFTYQKYNDLSEAYAKAGRYRDALYTQAEAVTMIANVQDKRLYEAELELSELFSLNQNETEAKLSLHRANVLANSLDDPNLILESTKYVAKFYEERGDWEKAFDYLAVHDSLSNSVLATQIRKLENDESVIKASEEEVIAVNASFFDEFKSLSGIWQITAVTSVILLFFVIFLLVRGGRKRRKIRQILEWKVYKRTKELRLLNSELNTYIYKSSHDLRNPLTSIKSLITLLKTEELNDNSQKYISLIEGCADQMDEILINLSRAVDYKRLEVKVEQVSFNTLKHEVEQFYEPELEGLNIDWNIREKAPFFSDPNLIKVILKKTILNSLQYRIGSSNDYCKVSILTDSSGAHVSIEDNGQGISEKVKDSVFDMFVKGTHKSKGAGLGLYLVKIASDKIRAKITLESKENQGSKLVFELPNLA